MDFSETHVRSRRISLWMGCHFWRGRPFYGRAFSRFWDVGWESVGCGVGASWYMLRMNAASACKFRVAGSDLVIWCLRRMSRHVDSVGSRDRAMLAAKQPSVLDASYGESFSGKDGVLIVIFAAIEFMDTTGIRSALLFADSQVEQLAVVAVIVGTLLAAFSRWSYRKHLVAGRLATT